MIKKLFLLTLFASLMIAKNATAAECLAGECPENHTSCKCNEQGKLIEAVYVSEYYTAVKTYDGAGHNTSTLDYRNAEDFASNTPFSKSVYTYDGAGRRTSSLYYDGAESITNNTPTGKMIMTFGDDGQENYYISSNKSCSGDKCYEFSQERVLDENGVTRLINHDTQYSCTGSECTKTGERISATNYNCNNGSCYNISGEGTNGTSYTCDNGMCVPVSKSISTGYPYNRDYACNGNTCTETGGAFANYDSQGRITSATNSHTCNSQGCSPRSGYDEYDYDENGNIIKTQSQCSNAVCTPYRKMVETPDNKVVYYTCDGSTCTKSSILTCPNISNSTGWQQTCYGGSPTTCETENCTSLPNTMAGAGKTVIYEPTTIEAGEAHSADGCPAGYRKKDGICVYSPEDHEIICTSGYIEGCVAGAVTLADGSTVMMKNGEIVGCMDGYDLSDGICAPKLRYTLPEADAATSNDNENMIEWIFE